MKNVEKIQKHLNLHRKTYVVFKCHDVKEFRAKTKKLGLKYLGLKLQNLNPEKECKFKGYTFAISG